MVKLCLTTLCVYFLASFIFCQTAFVKRDLKGNATENFSSQGAKLYISTEKNRFEEKEKIPIHMEVLNEGFYPITLYIHKEILKNFVIIARDTDGKPLLFKETHYIKKKNYNYLDAFHQKYTATNFHSRAIVLQPKESFKVFLDLQDLVEMPFDIKSIELNAFFYPNPEQSSETFLESLNKISLFIVPTLNIKKPFLVDDVYVAPMEITPKETVYLALSAEYSKEWSNFFKYISLEDLILDYPVFAKEYILRKENERGEVIANFQKYLITRKDYRLLRFQVYEEVGNKSENSTQVKVKAVREIDGFKREFTYTYYLTKIDSFWQITGLSSHAIQK